MGVKSRRRARAGLAIRQKSPVATAPLSDSLPKGARHTVTNALIDRLLHHCHTVDIRGNSYGMKQYADLFNTLRNSPTSKDTETST